jgi:EAL domain-containing protein (putative c-di-GMP-specific phosphodiesterase class I)
VLELNVDYLKIDASLIKNITTNENSKKITQTIIGFASNLGLKTIAEYVEDEASFNLLKKMGIDFIQGYYIGKPEKDLLS